MRLCPRPDPRRPRPAGGGAADRPKVVTTFTVLADMARNVAGEAAEVELLTKPGAEIHYYQPTPGDIRRAQDADLLLWNGLNLEQWFERFLRNFGDVPSAVLSEGVEPMGIAEGPYEGKPNPHAWMSPEVGGDLRREHPRGAERRSTRRTPSSTPPTPPPISRRSAPSPSRSAPSSRRSPRSGAGSPPPRAPSATSPATSASRALHLADQRRPAGLAAAGAQGDRRHARARGAGDLLREHDPGGRGRAGRPRDRRGIWRRPLRRQPVRADGPVPTYLDMLQVTASTIAAALAP